MVGGRIHRRMSIELGNNHDHESYDHGSWMYKRQGERDGNSENLEKGSRWALFGVALTRTNEAITTYNGVSDAGGYAQASNLQQYVLLSTIPCP